MRVHWSCLVLVGAGGCAAAAGRIRHQLPAAMRGRGCPVPLLLALPLVAGVFGGRDHGWCDDIFVVVVLAAFEASASSFARRRLGKDLVLDGLVRGSCGKGNHWDSKWT